MMRLLWPPHIGIFLRSFHSHSTHYARETIAEICSMWRALVTAVINQPGSYLHFSSSKLRMLTRAFVFCGSSSGTREVYQQAAQARWRVLARRGSERVSGG